MRVVLVCVAAFLAVYGIGVTVAYLAASSDAQHQKARLAAADKLAAQDQARLIPVPALRTVDTYGPPYNVTITCTVAGSAERDGGRVPLDVDAPPRPGDVYVKTCRAA